MNTRREFLQVAAGFLPLGLLRFPTVNRLADPQQACDFRMADVKRLHKRVMAAFDFGATLTAQPWTMFRMGVTTSLQEFPSHLVWLQNKVPELKRGEYEVITSAKFEWDLIDYISVVVNHAGHWAGQSLTYQPDHDWRRNAICRLRDERKL